MHIAAHNAKPQMSTHFYQRGQWASQFKKACILNHSFGLIWVKKTEPLRK